MKEINDSTLLKVNLLITMKRLSIINYDRIMFKWSLVYGRDVGKLVVEWL